MLEEGSRAWERLPKTCGREPFFQGGRRGVPRRATTSTTRVCKRDTGRWGGIIKGARVKGVGGRGLGVHRCVLGCLWVGVGDELVVGGWVLGVSGRVGAWVSCWEA